MTSIAMNTMRKVLMLRTISCEIRGKGLSTRKEGRKGGREGGRERDQPRALIWTEKCT